MPRSIVVAVFCSSCRRVRAANRVTACCTACRVSFESGHAAHALLRFDLVAERGRVVVNERIDLVGAWSDEESERAIVALRALEEPAERRVDTDRVAGPVVELAAWRARRTGGSQ